MDYTNGDYNEMWPWHGKDYYLGENSSLDISNCTLNGLATNEQDFLCTLNSEATPVTDLGDSSYLVTDDGNMMKVFEHSRDISSQVTSRRMLQFDLEHSGFSLSNEDLSTFLRSKKRKDSFEEDLSEIPEWVASGTEDTSLSCDEALDESSEGWIASCFNDEMQFNPEDTNASASSDIHIDITELQDLKRKNKTTACQRHPVSTRQDAAFKGKKSSAARRKRLPSSVVYPFAFIKPCGLQGNVTLADINHRLHMPSSRAKKENEDLFLYPRSSFSGKPVVGKTKIHTEGKKGSITIMRTRG